MIVLGNLLLLIAILAVVGLLIWAAETYLHVPRMITATIGIVIFCVAAYLLLTGGMTYVHGVLR